MSNRAGRARLAASLILAALLALCAAFAAAESADPIRVSSACDPQSVINVQEVTVTIRVYNSSQTDMNDEITLFGPDGISVVKYAGLAGEQSVTYTGTWQVTQEEIDQGHINYYIRYSVNTGGETSVNTRTIPVAIRAEAAAPQLGATYSISPAAAHEGQEVTLTYTLSNTGNVELRNIVISNPGVTDEQLKTASLSVGERVTLQSRIKMGKEALVSNPSVVYEAADSGVQLTISDMARRTITIARDDIDVTIEGENLSSIYPGESVELKATVKNDGESAYSNLAIVLPDGTVAVSGIGLGAGETYEKTLTLPVAQSGKLSVSVTGTDDSGQSVTFASNELDAVVQDAAQALILRVRAQARETTVYSEPAVIRFAIVVDNIGQTDATDLTVSEAGVEVAKIPSLPAGQSKTLVLDLQSSIAGQFRFAVSGLDAAGNERQYDSNTIRVTYIEPTPAPTATPAPTPVPPTPSPVPTATPEPTLAERIGEITAKINPVVLYTVAGVLAFVILLVLIVSGIRSVRFKKRMAGALDTLQLSPDVRNYKGHRRAGKKAEKQDEQQSVVSAPELTDEEAAAPKEEPAGKPEGEGRKHRPEPEKEAPPEETLRVAPVDQRPDFIDRRKVDDSATRVFSRVRDGETHANPAQDTRDPSPVAQPERDKAPAENKSVEAHNEIRGVGEGETIRLNDAELSELRKQQAKKSKPASNRPKPMKKKKKGLFSRAGEDDDMIEDYDTHSDSDDDLFE